MNSEEARIEQINDFLGGGISSLIKHKSAKLFFESNAEAKKGDKTNKPCILYIIGEYVLICRPRKYGKKYYIKYQLPICNIQLSGDFSGEEDEDKKEDAQQNDTPFPFIISAKDRNNNDELYYVWLPSYSVGASFYDRFEEAYDILNNKDTFRPCWKPFPHPIIFSYHNEILQRYSYVQVTQAGTSDVNGTYYPIGVFNHSLIWENKYHMFLSREYIDNTLGWMFGNMQQCFYGQPTEALFPPSNTTWNCYSGKEPKPKVVVSLGGECESSFRLKSELKLSQTELIWDPELERKFLHSMCEEFYFSEKFYNDNLRLTLSVYRDEMIGYSNSKYRNTPSTTNKSTLVDRKASCD